MGVEEGHILRAEVEQRITVLPLKYIEFRPSHRTLRPVSHYLNCDAEGADPPRFSAKPTCHVLVAIW